MFNFHQRGYRVAKEALSSLASRTTLEKSAMFLLPFSLYLLTMYLRPRTQAELSYLITAIEVMSGLWCLLFAPATIQIGLIALILVRHTQDISSLVSGFRGLSGLTAPPSNIDLSTSDTPTIDIVAHPIPQAYLSFVPAADTPALTHPTVVPPSDSASSTMPLSSIPQAAASNVKTSVPSVEVTLYSPQSHIQNHIHRICHEQQTAPLATTTPLPATTQIVQMQYRGVTYFKRVQCP